MTETERVYFDETQQGVLGGLLDNVGNDGERMRDAKMVQEAGGLMLFDAPWACELWRRVDAALKDGKDPNRYKHVKQVDYVPFSMLESIIQNGVSGVLLEHTYLPKLVHESKARKLKRAMKEALDTGDTSQVESAFKENMALTGLNTSPAPAALESVEEWERAAERPGVFTGIKSGLIDLDRMTWGWQKQNLIIIGARPSQGKTALLIGFTRQAAIEDGVPTAFFSLESSKKEIVRRLLCQISGSDQSRMRGGQATERDVSRLPEAVSKVSRSPLHIVDCPGASIGWIHKTARGLKECYGIQLIVIDYLQKIKPTLRNEKKTYEVAQVSDGLKEIAKDLDVPVIAAGQLSREPEKAKGRPPLLSDLADCGQIERDADIVGLKHLKLGKDGAQPIHQLILAKFRDGPTGTVNLSFNPGCARFDNLGKIDPDDVPPKNSRSWNT